MRLSPNSPLPRPRATRCSGRLMLSRLVCSSRTRRRSWTTSLSPYSGSRTKNFLLANRSEPLVIYTQSGYTIYTNHLVWTDQTREIRTQDPVHIVGNGLDVKGRGLLGHLDTEEFEVLEDVHVEVAPVS